MKKLFLLAAVVLLSPTASIMAQDDAPRDTSYWTHSGAASLTFGQTSFTNWAAGGENSVSVLAAFAGKWNYAKDRWMWDNSADLGYGLTYQGSDQIKNDDHIDLATRLGYKASATWAYAAELNFKSQFNKGYSKYPVTDDAAYISKLMAPGYLLGSIGMTYTHPREDLKVLISPVSEKMTFVSDRRLSDEGAYGVEKGDRVLAEFGALIKGTYSKKITENVLFNTEVLRQRRRGLEDVARLEAQQILHLQGQHLPPLRRRHPLRRQRRREAWPARTVQRSRWPRPRIHLLRDPLSHLSSSYREGAVELVFAVPFSFFLGDCTIQSAEEVCGG